MHQPRTWMMRFDSSKKDPIEGWYFDLGGKTRPIPLIDTEGKHGTFEEINPGDHIADFALNQTPYWVVSGTDPSTGRVFVDPVEPNPFTTGIGAGGKELTQHDFDVHSGDYEKERVDQILKNISDKKIRDPGDVAYILLGTVPVNMGPNGSQGGWYSSGDTYSNRGGRKGMDEKEIQMKDAATLAKMGFDVPPKALRGKLNSQVWNAFVNSGSHYGKPYGDEDPEQYDDLLAGEDYADPDMMSKFILNHPQQGIRKRNAEALINYYRGRDRIDSDALWKLEKEVLDAYNAGHYKRKELEPFIREIARKLSDQPPDDVYNSGDNRYWATHEQFINLARMEGWDDVLRLFEKAHDPSNRRYVFYHYSDENNKDVQSILRMLDHETTAENLSNFLGSLLRYAPREAIAWCDRNQQKLNKALVPNKWDGGYHAGELRKVLGRIQDFKNALGDS